MCASEMARLYVVAAVTPSIVAECTDATALSAADNAVLQKISGYSFYIGIGHSF